ncbi:MAG: hypothetical protein IJ221_04490 [Oscillibacter sp.]|nr:hypothetical protein [Oscillibacter sp.]
MNRIFAAPLALMAALSFAACAHSSVPAHSAGTEGADTAPELLPEEQTELVTDRPAAPLERLSRLESLIDPELRKLLIVDLSREDALVTVSEKASAEAGRRDWGDGALLSLYVLDEGQFHDLLCGAWCGREPFAMDPDGKYYVWYHPSDVRFVRASQEAYESDEEWAQWTMLLRYTDSLREPFLAANPDLTPCSTATAIWKGPSPASDGRRACAARSAGRPSVRWRPMGRTPRPISSG